MPIMTPKVDVVLITSDGPKYSEASADARVIRVPVLQGFYYTPQGEPVRPAFGCTEYRWDGEETDRFGCRVFR